MQQNSPDNWEVNEAGQLILFKLPPTLNLIPSNPVRPSRPARLPSLPSDVHFLIVSYLHPVDRVCFALACKSLCQSVLSAPSLTPATWRAFSYYSADSSSAHPHANYIPEKLELFKHLGRGWIDKTRWRYCWKCQRILSRRLAYWEAKSAMAEAEAVRDYSTPRRSLHSALSWFRKGQGKLSAVFLTSENERKALLPRHRPLPPLQINRVPTRLQLYSHLLDLWTQPYASFETATYNWPDCVHCKAYNPTGILDGACQSALACADGETGRWSGLRGRKPTPQKPIEHDEAGSAAAKLESWYSSVHPIECPDCLEKELTWKWKIPEYRSPARGRVFTVRRQGNGLVSMVWMPVLGVIWCGMQVWHGLRACCTRCQRLGRVVKRKWIEMKATWKWGS